MCSKLCPLRFVDGDVRISVAEQKRSGKLVAQKATRGIFLYNICLISISNAVSDGATNKSVLNIESS